MDTQRTVFLATLIVIATGAFWGLYWIPVREIAALGLDGAWGSLAIVVAATVVLAPFGWRGRAALRASDPIAIASVALGGFAFLLYSVGFLYGRVALIVILFYLTPIWSTLLASYFLKVPITRLRVFVLVLGLFGLVVMLGGDGEVPVPQGLGDWLGLASGFLWALAIVGIRAKATAGPGESAFVFAAGAAVGGLAIAPFFGPFPDMSFIIEPSKLVFWVTMTGGLWWALSLGGLMWAATKLDPARVGILLMAEVVIAPLTAALIAGEVLSAMEILGGVLVLIAGAFEIWPERQRS